MYVIGTAGHVDHGKSTLIRQLTGIDPDRWEEEKLREMTIDLGFAWLTLPGGREVSLIDVPGHERFIKNMLAGVGGIDAALLVVAADESVMPQTVEHLAILDLLGVTHGVVVLTKADLVDAAWLDLVYADLDATLHGTSFAAAPRVLVSARTGQGLPTLLQTLEELLDAVPTRSQSAGVPRLPIDRAFTIGGFGTVVTGTLLDGPLHSGQAVELLPQGLRARIRGLQIHKQRSSEALPGTRLAVNLTGVHPAQIARGDLLTLPDALTPTSLIDMQLRLLPTAPRPLEHNTLLDLFIGAAEVRCHAALLDCEALEPGATGWVQLRLQRPIVAVRGERCIVRQPSPSLTIGGGVIVDGQPPRHRRFRAEVITALETRVRGAPKELLLQAVGVAGPRRWEDVRQASGMDARMAQAGRELLLRDGRLLQLGDEVVITAQGWQATAARLTALLQTYHQRLPLRRGMAREELRQRLALDPLLFSAVLTTAHERGLIEMSETHIRQAGHTPALTPEQRRAVDACLQRMQQSPYLPPTPDLEGELLTWMLDQELLVRISDDIYFLPATYTKMLDWVRTTIAQEGSLSVAQFRDRFGSSRKYALAFLEHLDARRITRRSGDVRRLV
jgi:selenocysteine-specific elongation factor